MISRQKGRDFYDVMYLLSQINPDYSFLSSKHSISGPDDLKNAVTGMLKNIDLKMKSRDFEHLLFNRENSVRILRITEFFNEM